MSQYKVSHTIKYIKHYISRIETTHQHENMSEKKQIIITIASVVII